MSGVVGARCDQFNVSSMIFKVLSAGQGYLAMAKCLLKVIIEKGYVCWDQYTS